MTKKALLGQVSDVELRLLRIFRAVVECGGLTAAELDLNIGRSTISRHLADLEDRLGLVLCRRGRGGFALTPEGRRVHDGALALLAALDVFRADVREMHSDLYGTLTIGLFDKTATNPAARIGNALRDLRRIAPEVSLDVTVGTLSAIESGVIDGRLHIGVVPDHRRSDSLQYVELFQEQMCLYCGSGHPLVAHQGNRVSWQEIRSYDYAGLAYHSPNMEASHRFQLRRHATASDQEAIATMILSDCYVGFLPDHYASTFIREGLMQRVPNDECMYEVKFVAILQRQPERSRLATAFLEALERAHRSERIG